MPVAMTQSQVSMRWHAALQVISEHKKWVIYRGATVSDSTMVATVKKALWSMHSGVEVRLAGGSKAEYTLRQQGIITGRREVDIMHHNRVIGRVRSATPKHAIHPAPACPTCLHVPYCILRAAGTTALHDVTMGDAFAWM